MATYRKRTIHVEAKWLKDLKPETIEKCLRFIHEDGDRDIAMADEQIQPMIEKVIADEGIYIKTLEGTMKADAGDFIIKGIMGEFYPCKEVIFRQTYDLANYGETDED